MRTAAKIFGLLVCLLLVRAAHANSCYIVSASIAFGNYSSGSALTGTGSVSISCNKTVNVTMQFSTGSGTFAQRTMKATPSGTLNYNLYTDSSYSTIWGDGNNNGTGTVSVTVPGTGTYPVYGLIPAGQMSPIGSYSDTLTLTVIYDNGGGTKSTVLSPFMVTASVTSACTISSNPMAFGSFGGLTLQTANWDQVTTISYTCATGAAATYIGLSQGLYPAGGSTDQSPLRRMSSGPNYLSYQLYQDASRTQVWGNTSTSGWTGPFTNNGTPQSVTVYGRVPSPQTPAAGSYADTVVVTVNF